MTDKASDIRQRVERELVRFPLFERYPVPDLDFAITVLLEQVEQWEWREDQHGWCHQRTVLLAVLDALTVDEQNDRSKEET